MPVMNKPVLLIRDLVLLQDMCLERELRCEQRALQAERKGDWTQADYQRRLQQRFSQVKQKFWDHLRDEGTRLPEACNESAASALRAGEAQSRTAA